MKTRNFILCVFIVLVAVLLWLLTLRQKVLVESAHGPTIAVQSGGTTFSNSPAIPFAANSDIPTPKEFAKMKPEREQRRHVLEERSFNEWKTPIEFYGRVVDENNAVVPEVQIDFSCNDTSRTGTSYYHTTSDMNGGFSITGIQGKLLQVSVNKDGYYSYDPHGQYFYYSGQNQNFVPDAGNPVVFRIRKKGKAQALITSIYPGFAHVAQLKHDGTPVELNLFNGTQVAAGSGQLVLQFWRDLANNNTQLFDWKLEVSVPGGGLIETNEPFAFLAPETGYQSPVILNESTNDPAWKGSLKNQYYLQLPDGKYGRIDFEFLPFNGTFNVHSVINPSGSRNLEPP